MAGRVLASKTVILILWRSARIKRIRSAVYSDYNRCPRYNRGFLLVISKGDEVLGIHIGPALPVQIWSIVT